LVVGSRTRSGRAPAPGNDEFDPVAERLRACPAEGDRPWPRAGRGPAGPV